MTLAQVSFRIFALLAVITLFSGCQVTGLGGSRKVLLHGSVWFAMACKDRGRCLEEAQEVCPGGYREAEESLPHDILFTCTSGKANWSAY